MILLVIKAEAEMRNLYNAVPLTDEQKISYIRVLAYLAKADRNPAYIERDFMGKMFDRMKLSADVLKKIYIPFVNKKYKFFSKFFI